MVGAGVIAVAPMGLSMTPPRIVDAQAALSAKFDGLSQSELASESAKRFVEQLAQAPLLPLVLAAQLAGGGNDRLYSQIRQIVDAPLYVADPLIEAVADTLPPALGGGSNDDPSTSAGDGDFMQFRNEQLLGLRDAVNAQVAEVLGVDPAVLNDNYAAALAAGLIESAQRSLTGAINAPFGIVPIAQAMVTGDSGALYLAIRQYIDAPLWAADPAIEGLAQALPPSLGGGSDGNFTTDDPKVDGALMHFRNQTLWGATRDTRRAVADVLDVKLDPQDNPEDPQPGSSESRDVTRLKPHFTKLDARIKQANERAEARADKAKTRGQAMINGAREMARNMLGANKSKPPTKPQAATANEANDAQDGNDTDKTD